MTLMGSPNVIIANNITYDPFGPISGWTWGSGRFFTRTFDTDDEVREQIAGARPATAVIGGGVGAGNAGEQLDRAGTRDGVMLLLGSAAYAHPDGVRAGVEAAVEAIG
jgi:ribulose 1,5-bisphosphate carboxylase large subunit-like protein